MLALISPAKKLNFDRENSPERFTDLRFQKETSELLKTTSKLKAVDLKSLMKLSDDLSELNYKRFQSLKFPFTPDNAKQAAFAFNGDTYAGFDAPTLSTEDLDYAQDHLRILSGLYGVLRPLDLIQPYRLEMGRKIATKSGNTLYAYWSDRIGNELDLISGGIIVNLASNEYFKATGKKMNSKIITPSFKEERGGELKMIGFFAKKARGSMARFMIQNSIKDLKDLKSFNEDGYSFRSELSDTNNWVFTRKTV